MRGRKTRLLFVLLHELDDDRHHMLAEFAAVEDAVMADAFLHVVLAHRGGKVFAQMLRCFGLADAGDIIQLAFEREKRRFGDGFGFYFFALIDEFRSLGSRCFWKTCTMLSK